MSKKQEYAFPQSSLEKVGDLAIGKSVGGLTIRDYFAGQATIALITPESCSVAREGAAASGMDISSYLARMAYQFADAMIEERAKSK